jgi:hypothetical protein
MSYNISKTEISHTKNKLFQPGREPDFRLSGSDRYKVVRCISCTLQFSVTLVVRKSIFLH